MISKYNYLEGLERIDSRLQSNVDSNRIPTIPRFEECGSRGTMLCYGTVASIRLLPIEGANIVDESQKAYLIRTGMTNPNRDGGDTPIFYYSFCKLSFDF